MPKVDLNIKMNTNGEIRGFSIVGIRTDDIIKYVDEDSHIEVDLLNKRIITDNEDYTNMLTFDIDTVTILSYKLKKLDKEMELSIKTNKLEVDNNKFIVEYEVLDDSNTISNVNYELYIGGIHG